MPASEAQIRANRANAAKSTGPTSTRGKEASRANSYKHGLTGSGVVLPEREEAEVRRRYLSFVNELNPIGEVGLALTLRATRMSIRMESAAQHQAAMLTERVRKALADYEVPEGLDEAALAKLHDEVSDRANFDASKEATLARKYEAAAERSFFRCLKELQRMEKAVKAAEAELLDDKMGSFLPGEMTDDEFDKMCTDLVGMPPLKATRRVESDVYADLKARVDVPTKARKRR